MSTLVFLLEEESAKNMLLPVVKKLVPEEIPVQFITFSGKQDLERQLVKKIRYWCAPGSRFIIMRDKDSGDCGVIKQRLLALAQALERLSLLWPDGKLTLPRVEQAVNDAAHFTPFHWVDALLMGKSKRALHILQQLRLEGSEPVILLRTLQRELLLLVNLKRQSAHTPLRALFDKHRVWQNRRGMMGEALNRLSQTQLRQAVQLLTRTELTLKQDYGQSVWAELEGLSLLLCHKPLADVFIDG